MSERRACRVVRQWRGTQRYLPLRRTDEDELTQAILALAAKYGRYGYRRITALLQNGQRAGVYGRGVADVAGESGHPAVVHRAWESVGERVLRELQREAAR